MSEFPRIDRLPPYVFNTVNKVKAEARARGEDIIDFGMGNPDKPTPQPIVDKLIETVAREDTHRYSSSNGIPRLRKAISDWRQSRRTAMELARTNPGCACERAASVPNGFGPVQDAERLRLFVTSRIDIDLKKKPNGKVNKSIFKKAFHLFEDFTGN